MGSCSRSHLTEGSQNSKGSRCGEEPETSTLRRKPSPPAPALVSHWQQWEAHRKAGRQLLRSPRPQDGGMQSQAASREPLRASELHRPHRQVKS